MADARFSTLPAVSGNGADTDEYLVNVNGVWQKTTLAKIIAAAFAKITTYAGVSGIGTSTDEFLVNAGGTIKKTTLANIVANNVQPSYINRLINGDMMVNQEFGTIAVTPAASAYVTDQWKGTITQASKLTFQQVADAPPGFKYSTKITVAAQYAPVAADLFTFSQPIEGQNLIDMAFGTAAAASIAVTVWGKSSVAGTYSCFAVNGAGNRAYVGTIALTNSWTLQTIIMTADTTGTWPTDNTAALWFGVDLGSGTNYNVAAGAWNAAAFYRTAGSVTFVNQAAGSTLNITGAQFAKIPTGATIAPWFEFLSYEEQLDRCERIWEKTYDQGVNPGTANANGAWTSVCINAGDFYDFGRLTYRKTKRATPNIKIYSTLNGTLGKFTLQDASDVTALAAGVGMNGAHLSLSGGVAGQYVRGQIVIDARM